MSAKKDYPLLYSDEQEEKKKILEKLSLPDIPGLM